jgi:hypothetical protein
MNYCRGSKTIQLTNFLGINVHKAQHMERVLSNALKPIREQMKSRRSQSLNTKEDDVTHAWLLIQCMQYYILKKK